MPQHESFAALWDKNLRAQGFVEAFDRSRNQLTAPVSGRARQCARSCTPPHDPTARKEQSSWNTAVITATEYRDLPLAVLTESTTNPRRIFEEDALKELAESIARRACSRPCLYGP